MTFLLSMLLLLPGCCGRWNSCEKPCKPVCKPKCKPKCPKKCCRKICVYECGQPKIKRVCEGDPGYFPADAQMGPGEADMMYEQEMRDREMEDMNEYDDQIR